MAASLARGSARVAVVLALTLSVAIATPQNALAQERVEFHTAVLQSDTASAPARILGYLAKPRGAGPFPAAILLHSCLGLPANQRVIADALASSGYVSLFVDDFATRGLKETCTVAFAAGPADAYGALAYVAKLPFVDRTRIAAIGYSQGGDTALTLASRPVATSETLADQPRLQAVAAYYPPCANQADAKFAIPVAIFIGERDDVTPAEDCRRLVERQTGERAPARLIVIPGARHGFDNPSFGAGVRQFGMTLRYDRIAERRAFAELRAFLDSALAR